MRRKAKRRRNAGLFDTGKFDWRQRLIASYDAAQGWIVVTLIGAAIGLNAAFLNIITEWLSDIKLGHCKTAFYLNENFCCWGEDNGISVGVDHFSASANADISFQGVPIGIGGRASSPLTI